MTGCSVTNYRYCKYDAKGNPAVTETMTHTAVLIDTEKTGMEVILNNGSNLTLGSSKVDSEHANQTMQTLIPSLEKIVEAWSASQP